MNKGKICLVAVLIGLTALAQPVSANHNSLHDSEIAAGQTTTAVESQTAAAEAFAGAVALAATTLATETASNGGAVAGAWSAVAERLVGDVVYNTAIVLELVLAVVGETLIVIETVVGETLIVIANALGIVGGPLKPVEAFVQERYDHRCEGGIVEQVSEAVGGCPIA